MLWSNLSRKESICDRNIRFQWNNLLMGLPVDYLIKIVRQQPYKREFCERFEKLVFRDFEGEGLLYSRSS